MDGSPTAGVYRVFRDDSLLATVPAAVLTYADTVAAGTYIYGISAGNACGFSAPATESGSVVPNPASAGPQPLAEAFVLFPAAPNPLDSTTRIEFETPEACRVSLSIYDAGGRLVASLTNRIYPPGRFAVVWDGTDGSGQDVPTGVYFARMIAGAISARSRLVLLR
jgi:hypothetical protein